MSGRVKFYVLIETVSGKTPDVFEVVKKIPEVEIVDKVEGAYDLVIIAFVPNGNSVTVPGPVADFVTGKIHPIEGIHRTITLAAFD